MKTYFIIYPIPAKRNEGTVNFHGNQFYSQLFPFSPVYVSQRSKTMLLSWNFSHRKRLNVSAFPKIDFRGKFLSALDGAARLRYNRGRQEIRKLYRESDTGNPQRPERPQAQTSPQKQLLHKRKEQYADA
ncbi:MAG: hypothetical protein HDT26_10530 [Subdoligranulum sp.]|nr:hypothetical protein [Subdoligranulum sp.]